MTRKPVAIKARKSAVKSPANPNPKTVQKAARQPAASATPPVGMKSALALDADTDPKLRKSDFVDRVAIRSGLKKNEVRPVIEAALAVLGDALEAGEAVQLPPLGRMKVRKMTENDKGRTIVCQLRRNTAMRASPATGLANDYEDG